MFHRARDHYGWKRFHRLRPLLLFPPIIAINVLCFIDGTPWRGPLMAVTTVMTGIVMAHEFRSTHRWMRESTLLTLIPVLQGCAIVCTGAIDSPIFGIALGLGGFAGAQGCPWSFCLVQLSVFALIATIQINAWLPNILPAALGGPAHMHTSALIIITALTAGFINTVGFVLGRILRSAYSTAIEESVKAREEVVQLSTAHAKELQAVSGEISHELKNPLATVRGLVELMALDSPTLHNAERLRVLQREAVRMQVLLDDLLNLSRPLVPLVLTQIDLVSLCAEVVLLHEGYCAKSRVFLHSPPPTGARHVVEGDARKIKQVLMNLVQNSVEASSPGDTVTIALFEEPSGVRITVVDEGSGLDEVMAVRAFDAGATSKTKGTGLGLTIARSLARQHGGELTLGPNSPRGCIASLTLPWTAVPTTEAE